MKVPATCDGKKLCDLDMSSVPAIDISFEHGKKWYKVIKVKESGDETDGKSVSYSVDVRCISEEEH